MQQSSLFDVGRKADKPDNKQTPPSLVLRPYQIQCVEDVLTAYSHGVVRQVVQASVGAGKTVIFAHLIPKIPQLTPRARQVLVLAHRTELIEQAAEKIRAANPTLRVAIEQAERRAPEDADVIVASVPTIGRKDSDRIQKFNPDNFKAVLTDECHRATAQSYRNIFNYFGVDSPKANKLLIGFTATPKRSDGVGLDNVFDEIVFVKSTIDLIEEKYLCGIRAMRITTSTDLSGVSIHNGDFAEEELALAINTPERNSLIVDTWQKHCENIRRSSLAFCSNVQHTEDLMVAFTERGIDARCITYKTPKDDRARFIAEFKLFKFPVLISVSALSEGTDIPNIDSLLLARPTQSTTVFIQAIGRGLRTCDGKPDCLIIDFVDACKGKSLVGLPSLLGLPIDFDLEGQDAVKIYRELQEINKENPHALSKAKTLAEARKLKEEEFDIFSVENPPDEVERSTTMKWWQVGQDHYRIDMKGGKEGGKKGRVEVTKDILGHWDVTHYPQEGTIETVRKRRTVDLAMQAAESFVKGNYNESLPLVIKNMSWKSGKPSEKQINFMKQIWVHRDDIRRAEKGEMTSGEASALIDKILMNRRNKKKTGKPKKTISSEFDNAKVGAL